MLLSALDMTKFAWCESETCFRNAHFSERHTMPIRNMFQDGTRNDYYCCMSLVISPTELVRFYLCHGIVSEK